MARSRRKRKLGKCFCGRGLIPYRGQRLRGVVVADCPVLHFSHQENDRRERFRERRADLRADVIPE